MMACIQLFYMAKLLPRTQTITITVFYNYLLPLVNNPGYTGYELVLSI